LHPGTGACVSGIPSQGKPREYNLFPVKNCQERVRKTFFTPVKSMNWTIQVPALEAGFPGWDFFSMPWVFVTGLIMGAAAERVAYGCEKKKRKTEHA
jgi:hypothetical protein